MATPNRFAIREVAEVTLYSLVSPYNAIVTLKTLKSSGVETKSVTEYARGGRGNAKIMGFSSNKEARVNLQDAIFDTAVMAQLTGNAITTGATTVDLIYEAVVPVGKTITIPKKVKSITSIYVLDTDGTTNKTLLASTTATQETKGVSYSITGQTVTTAEDVNTKIRVYYKAETDATAKVIKVTSNSFGGAFRMVMDCLVRDELTQADYAAKLVVFNAKVEDDWKFEMKSEGEPSPLDIPIEVLKNPSSQDMWQLIVYDESLIPSS